MNFELINVGIADVKITKSPNVLRTILGSCVGICIWDSGSNLGGLAHIMLPSTNKPAVNIKKYSETAIPFLVEEMVQAGARRSNMTAKICGGASMLENFKNSVMGDIGKNNIASVKKVLGELSIPILAEDTGNNYGRIIDFFVENGDVQVKSIGHELKII